MTTVSNGTMYSRFSSIWTHTLRVYTNRKFGQSKTKYPELFINMERLFTYNTGYSDQENNIIWKNSPGVVFPPLFASSSSPVRNNGTSESSNIMNIIRSSK